MREAREAYVDQWEIIRAGEGDWRVRGVDRYRRTKIDARWKYGYLEPRSGSLGRAMSFWKVQVGYDGTHYRLGLVGRGWLLERGE